MNYLYGLIEGLLAGFFGLLPLSSSGHRLMIGRAISLPSAEGLAFFAELGALLAVVIACRKTFFGMLKGFGQIVEKKKKGIYRRKKAPMDLMLLGYLLIACIPPFAAVIIREIYDYTEKFSQSLLWAGIGFLFSAGLIFIGAHSLCKNWKAEDIKGGHAFKLGLFRAVAGIIPGLSPLGATASMGMNMGFEPCFAADFAILLSAPSLLGSILWRIFGIGARSGFSFGGAVIAFAVAAISGYLAILLLRWLVKKEKFGLFLFYCLAAGIGAFVLNKF